MADNNVTLPKNAAVAAEYLKNMDRHRERGIMGRLFGGGSEKPGNIAGFVLICCFVALGVLGWSNPEAVKANLTEIVTGIVGLVTLTIGYVFGKISKE